MLPQVLTNGEEQDQADPNSLIDGRRQYMYYFDKMISLNQILEHLL